ncbi:arylamine N-acetyltransferase [Streptomyces sp. NPDC090442]|uniref:arylamine N-acetyltransferase family protein n=1 Tax=Streptomyces sp. NPDC090442 TaxID=3365962 RepID=UPI0038176457
MDDAITDAYLGRIGAPAHSAPSVKALRALQENHLLSVPFENLDFHLGALVQPGPDTLEKVITHHRGGSCRELNGFSFPSLLSALGYRVQLLASRIIHPDGALGAAFGHTVLRVDLARPFLVDVGFGRGSRYPLRLDEGGVQRDPQGDFQFVPAPHRDLDLLRDGQPILRLEARPRELADFLPTLWWFQTSPQSPFRKGPFCSLMTTEGRISLTGRTLTRTEYGRRSEEFLSGDDEVLAAYRDIFHIELDRLPDLGATTGASTP